MSPASAGFYFTSFSNVTLQIASEVYGLATPYRQRRNAVHLIAIRDYLPARSVRASMAHAPNSPAR
jgi:hypothetical protein